MWIPSAQGTFVIFLAMLLLLDFYYLYFSFSPEMEEFLLTMTGTNYNRLANTTLPIRLQAKFKMVNPMSIWIDYPLNRYLVHTLGLKYSFVTANMVSYLHPIMGFLAAYFILRSNRHAGSDQDAVLFTSISTDNVENPPNTPKARVALEDVTSSSYTQCMRLAACFFMARNFLDATDGVLARAQRDPNVVKSDVQTAGHSLDVITDLIGVIAIGSAMCMQLWRRRLTLNMRVPSRFRVTRPRVVVIGGLLYLAVCGCIWEIFMMKFSMFFDDNIVLNPALRDVERSAPVQLTYFLWALTCGDSMFTILVVGMLLPAKDLIWEHIQLFFFVGYPWLCLMIVHSVYVWNVVILGNPAVVGATFRS